MKTLIGFVKGISNFLNEYTTYVPFSLKETQTAPYLQMLYNIVHKMTWNGRYFRETQNYLDTNYLQVRISRRGPSEYPARWPELTPLGYFLWSYAKEWISHRVPNSIGDLRPWNPENPESFQDVRKAFSNRRLRDSTRILGTYLKTKIWRFHFMLLSIFVIMFYQFIIHCCWMF